MAFVAMTGSGSGVAIVDTRSGTVRYVTALGNVARVDLVLSRRTGRIYAATLDGHGLWRRLEIDERSGRIINTVAYPRAMGSVLALAIDERRGLLFAAYTQEFPVPGSVPAAGALQVIDMRSGHVRRTFPLGTGAAHLAVNERAGRLILLTMGGFDAIKPRDEWAWMPGWLRGRVPGIPPPPAQLQSSSSVTVVDTTRL